MATRDLKTLVSILANSFLAIATDTDTDGTAVDTATYQTVTFGFACRSWVAGEYAVELQQSDDDGDADPYAPVPAVNLIGSYPTLTESTADGTQMATVGVFGGKKYIKPIITSTNTDDPDGATIEVVVVGGLQSIAS